MPQVFPISLTLFTEAGSFRQTQSSLMRLELQSGPSHLPGSYMGPGDLNSVPCLRDHSFHG